MAVPVQRRAIRTSRQRYPSSIEDGFDVAADLPKDGYQALDGVGAAERAPQLVGQTETDDGEHFIQAFEDRSRDARRIVIEPARQVLENPLGLLGGRAVPGLTQHLLDPGMQRRVEPLNDVSPLVHLAALDECEAAEGVAH